MSEKEKKDELERFFKRGESEPVRSVDERDDKESDEQREYDEQVEETFPASDPPSSTSEP